MPTRNTLIVSLVLNLALLSALGYFVSSRPTMPPASLTPSTPSAPTPKAPQARPERAAVPTPTPGKFNWQQVESEDYKKYITNLRAIGCPEETIRDLIIADVNKFYFARVQGLAARVKEFKFWQAGVSRNKINQENRQQIQTLEREKWGLLRELLGAEVETEYRKTSFPSEYLNEELTLGFLPEAKRNQVREIVDQFAALEREITARSGGLLQPKDRVELKKVQDQRRASLAGLLTPEELEEYDLRTSSTAETLRNRLAGQQPTEEQFRQMFRAQKAYDDEFGNGSFALNGTPDFSKRATAQKQLETQMRTVLGEQPYAEYKRGQDPAYRGLVDVARAQNLPAETVNQVYEMKKAVDEQVRQVLDNQALPMAERMAALKTVSEETERALVQTLGKDGYEAYKQNGGTWASFVPTENGGTFTVTTQDGNNVSVRSFKMGNGKGDVTLGLPGDASTVLRSVTKPSP